MERALTSLADGTLPPWRRAAVRRSVARSAELARALEQQRFAVAVVRAQRDPAPHRLRVWLASAASTPRRARGS